MCVCVCICMHIFSFFFSSLFFIDLLTNKTKKNGVIKKKDFRNSRFQFCFLPFLFFGYFYHRPQVKIYEKIGPLRCPCLCHREIDRFAFQDKKKNTDSLFSGIASFGSSITAVSHFRFRFAFFSLLLDLFRFKNENSSIDITMTRKISLDYHNNYRSSANSSSTNVSSPKCFSFCTLVKVLGFILLYWCCSISLTFFNRHIFKDSEFPLSITATHMAVKFLLATLVRACLHRISRVRHGGSSNNHERERANLPWTILWRKIAPTGLTAALDIGLSNWSLQYITISLYGIDSIEICSSP